MKKSRFSLPLILCALLACASCQSNPEQGPSDNKVEAADSASQGHHHHHGQANEYMHQSDFEELLQRFDDPARDEWQQPELVLAKMGKLEGKTVMDIGCGSGYFSFRLQASGAKVIAADVDQRFLDHVEQKRGESGIAPELMETRKLPYDNPKLAKGEVDWVLIVDTYHHIENRVPYFADVLKGLKQPGALMVVDFKVEDSPVGPPKEMRIGAEQVKSELGEAGFSKFDIDMTSLPHQYILIAR
jgi:SAM-dependent methyltransferase